MRYRVTGGSYIARKKPPATNQLEEQRKKLITIAKKNVQVENPPKQTEIPKMGRTEEVVEEPRSSGRLEALREEVEELERRAGRERRELETVQARGRNLVASKKRLDEEQGQMLEALSEWAQETEGLYKAKDNKTGDMLRLQAKEKSLEEKLVELRRVCLTKGRR